MLSESSLQSLERCTIQNGMLTLGYGLVETEFIELQAKLRAALLNHCIPFYKPIAIKLKGVYSVQRVTNICADLDRSYIGMMEEFEYCILMPDEGIKTVDTSWTRVKNKDDRALTVARGLRAQSLGRNNLVYVRSNDCGEITLDKCIYELDTDSEDYQMIYTKPLITDAKPIVSISDKTGSMINMEFVFARATEEVSYRDITYTMGNIGCNYLPIAQTYGLEQYVLISPADVGFGKIKMIYKRHIDESVLQDIFRGFARRMLSNFESSRTLSTSPVTVFCTGQMWDVRDMWRARA